MNLSEMTDGRVRLHPLPDFDPVATFLCGQCFRWKNRSPGTRLPERPAIMDAGVRKTQTGICREWIGIAGSHTLQLIQEPSALLFASTTLPVLREHWLPYLDLDTDYAPIREQLSDADPLMAEAIRFGQGLRLLRQDPWEALVTFLISQNNGIPRIAGIVDTMCTHFGDAVPFEDGHLHRFPSPEAVASLSEASFAVCRAGYRSGYVLQTARRIAEGRLDLAGLAALPYEEARERLLTLHGVGVKVADCVLLFSGLHRTAFPVDRWVFRVMDALYPGSGNTTEALQAFARDRWGEHAGLAQEYLFHFARHAGI